MSLTFIIAAESAITPKPAERSFDHPPSRKHFECMLVGAFDDFNRATPEFLDVIDQSPSVTAIGPDVFDAAWCGLSKERSQQLPGPVAVLNVRGQNHHTEDQTDGIDQDMPLASVDLLAGIVASLVANFGTFDGLTVDDPRAGVTFAPFDQTHLFPQMVVNSRPQTIVLPQPEVMVDRGPWCKVVRQVAPLATGLDYIENGIDQLPQPMLARSASLAGLGQAIFNEFPFTVREVRSVSHPQFVKGCASTYKLSL